MRDNGGARAEFLPGFFIVGVTKILGGCRTKVLITFFVFKTQSALFIKALMGFLLICR
jgi:hypothetical protein